MWLFLRFLRFPLLIVNVSSHMLLQLVYTPHASELKVYDLRHSICFPAPLCAITLLK